MLLALVQHSLVVMTSIFTLETIVASCVCLCVFTSGIGGPMTLAFQLQSSKQAEHNCCQDEGAHSKPTKILIRVCFSHYFCRCVSVSFLEGKIRLWAWLNGKQMTVTQFRGSPIRRQTHIHTCLKQT